MSYNTMMALTLVGMQGVINRNEPSVYLDWISNDNKNASRNWLSLLRQHIDVEYLDLNGLTAINFLFERYGSRFRGAVIYDPALPDTINLATMIAGLENRIILAPEQVALPGIPRFDSITDLRQLVKEQGWDATEGGKYRLYTWVYDNLWPRLEHRIIGVISPGPPTSREILGSSGQFYPLTVAARDYLIALRLTALWLSPLEEPQATLFARFLSDAPSPIVVTGAFGNDEVGTVNLASRYGDWVAALTWPGPSLQPGSLTVLSGVPLKLKPYRAEMDTDRIFSTLGNGPVATVWSSDGDAIFFQTDRGYHGVINFLWEAVQGQRFGWTINPTLVDLASLVWNYYVESRSEVSLVAGLSGAGYMYPALMNDTQLGTYLEYASRYLKETGLRALHVDDRFGTFDNWHAKHYYEGLRNSGYLGAFAGLSGSGRGLGFYYAGVPAPVVPPSDVLNSTNGARIIEHLLSRKPGEDFVDLGASYTGEHWGQVVQDKNAVGGDALFFSRQYPSCCLVVKGPFPTFAPGTYTVTFRLKVPDNKASQPVAQVYVGLQQGKDWRSLAWKFISPSDFERADQYQNFTLSFTLDSFITDGLQFRVDFYGGLNPPPGTWASADLFVDFVLAKRDGGLGLPIFAGVFLALVTTPQRLTEAPQMARDLERAGGVALHPDEFLAVLNPEFMIEWAAPILGKHLVLDQARAQLSDGDYLTSLLTVREALRKLPERTYPLQVEDKGRTLKLAVRANTWITDYTFNQAKREISFRTHGPPSGTVQMSITVPNELIDGPLLMQVDGRSEEFTRTQNATHTTLMLQLLQGPHDVLVQLKRQYLVEVFSEFGNPVGMGLYVEGTRVTISVNTPIGISPGVRLVFDRWSGDISSNNNVVSITVDRPIRVSANWRKQFILTVNANGGSVTGGDWYDAGITATFSAISPYETVPGKTRLLFTKWSGDSSSVEKAATILMNSPLAVTANWKAQHYLSVDPGPGEVGQGSQWLDEGATITIRATTPSRVEPESSRLIFVGWSGDITSMDTSTTLRIDGSKTVVANWKTQYYLRVISERGNPQGDDWYDAGTEATFSIISPLGTIIRDVFDVWTGDFSGKTTVGTITMDSPKSVVANWRRDYTILLFIMGVASVASAGVGAAWALSKKRTKLS